MRGWRAESLIQQMRVATGGCVEASHVTQRADAGVDAPTSALVPAEQRRARMRGWRAESHIEQMRAATTIFQIFSKTKNSKNTISLCAILT